MHREEYSFMQPEYSKFSFLRPNQFKEIISQRISISFFVLHEIKATRRLIILQGKNLVRYPTSVRPFCRASRHVRAFMKSADKSIRDGGELVLALVEYVFRNGVFGYEYLLYAAGV